MNFSISKMIAMLHVVTLLVTEMFYGVYHYVSFTEWLGSLKPSKKLSAMVSGSHRALGLVKVLGSKATVFSHGRGIMLLMPQVLPVGLMLPVPQVEPLKLVEKH